MATQPKTRSVVLLLAGIAAAVMTLLVAARIRVSARDTFTAYACEHGWISADTCYPDTGQSSFYENASKEIMAEDALQKELAPILAEQKRLEAEKREWDKNRRAADKDVQRAFILGCERDKLTMMQNGQDNSGIDCRKTGSMR